MTARRLSPAMRQMLHNAIHDQPLSLHLIGGDLKNAQTRRALQARGMLDADLIPTHAGRAVFAPLPVPRGYAIWHLTGPEGCGKTLFAGVAQRVIATRGVTCCHMDAWTFARQYGGNPERVAEDFPGLKVLMIETNTTRSDGLPTHFVQGDRTIDLTDSLQARRPEVLEIGIALRLDHPDWSESKVLSTAKGKVTTHEAAPC